jgi:hypothetical protein
MPGKIAEAFVIGSCVAVPAGVAWGLYQPNPYGKAVAGVVGGIATSWLGFCIFFGRWRG